MNARLVAVFALCVLLAPAASAEPLPAPTNLTADLVNGAVVLVWEGMDQATSYNVYRDGELIGIAVGTTFTDNLPTGVAVYWVTGQLEDRESPPSNPAQSGPCAGPSLDPPFFYVNPEDCEDYAWEVVEWIVGSLPIP